MNILKLGILNMVQNWINLKYLIHIYQHYKYW